MTHLKQKLIDFEVTLAHKRSDRLDVEQGCFIQPKLDGVRCYITKDGAFSRNHKPFNNMKHILTELKPLFDYAPELILDGELYNHKFKNNFNKIISLVRKSKPTQADRFESASYLQFHNYDVFDTRRPNLLYTERWHMLQHLKYKYKFLFVKAVSTTSVQSQGEVDMINRVHLAQGYEGSMLRANEAYQQRRSHGLQKVKSFMDTEFTITGYVEGKGKFAKGLGKFLGTDENGLEIEVPYQRCTIENRRKIWRERKSYLGKIATFEYFERTPDGAYRFPQFKTLRNYE